MFSLFWSRVDVFSAELGEPDAHIGWKQVHTDSLAVDFLLREGHIQCAQQLADEANIQVPAHVSENEAANKR